MFYKEPRIVRGVVADTPSKFLRMCEKMKNLEEFAFDTETNTLNVVADSDEFICVGISISWGFANNYYIPLGHRRYEDRHRNLSVDLVRENLGAIFGRKDVRVIGHNLKFDMHVMKRLGIDIATDDLVDTMILEWLCDENTPNGLKETTSRRLGIPQTHFADVVKAVPKEVKKEFGLRASNKATMDLTLIDDSAPYALDDAFYTWCNYVGLIDLVRTEKMNKIYDKVYRPFLRVLFDMEERGACVDTDKLERMKDEVIIDLARLLTKIYGLAGVEINPKSNQQLQELLFGYVPEGKQPTALSSVSFKFRVLSRTNSGAPQCNADTLWNLSQMEFKTKRKQEGVEFCKALLEYKKLAKLSDAFITGLSKQLYPDGKAHPTFNIIGASSGRLSCVAEGTPIKCLGEDRAIQDIKAGDLVYCYDESGNLHLRKVLKVVDNGVRPCVSINWSSQGSHDKGNLVCTPDHKIRLRSGAWVRADELKHADKVTHLRRSTANKRPRLYGLNSLCVQEQVFIKKEVFGVTDKDTVIHHKDHNVQNNSLVNLELMSREEHTRLHTNILLERGAIDTYTFCHSPRKVLRGKDSPNYIKCTAQELESMVRSARGKIRDIPMGFNTFKQKCREVGFDYKKVAGEYQTRYRDVTDDEFIDTFYACNGVPYAIHKKLGIGRTKVQNAIERLNLCTNHSVDSVTLVGNRHVYDLEVEDFHNFIASEICVHNCSRPNLQQLPKADEEDKYQIRSLFIGSLYIADPNTGEWLSDHLTQGEIKRKKIVALDFANLEMRVLAHWSRDENLINMFLNDEDTHGSTAVNMFELDCTPDEVKKKYPHLRQAAKVINFLLMYGGSAPTLYENLKSDHYSPIDLGAQSYLDTYKVKTGVDVAQIYIDKYFASYKGITKFIREQKRYAHRHGYVYTLLKRKRRLPSINSASPKDVAYCERLAVNACIQGSAADLTMSAQVRVFNDPWYKEHGVNMILQVHDELVFECPEECVDECIRRTKHYMEYAFGDGVELNLPMRADADSGDNYSEAK